ncbi:MAG TPA: serine/threonine-protein kinase [Polyangiaceae bacterium]
MAASDPIDPFGLVGSVVDRQFRVDQVVGEGGFGVVYKGWHLSLDQPVALKALKLDARDPGLQGALLAKFREEAKITYVLSQATLNIVRIIDFGATTAPTGAWVPFAVQEWLEGETLARELRRRRGQGLRGRTLGDAMRILEPAARALGIAHQRRVVHRDVKPGNFFLLAPPIDAQGLILKVLDFGIAKVLREGVPHSGTTSAGMVSFTPKYAAPEQLESRYGPAGPWTDVYSLALVMTELLGDCPALEGDDLPSIMAQVIDPHRRPTPRTRGIPVPDALEAVLARALAVDPRARPADANELWAALSLAVSSAAQALPTPPPASTMALSLPYPSGPYAPPFAAAASPGAPRAASLLAAVVGVGLGLLVLLALATWIVTRR